MNEAVKKTAGKGLGQGPMAIGGGQAVRTSDELDPDDGLQTLDVMAPRSLIRVFCAISMLSMFEVRRDATTYLRVSRCS